MTAPFDTPVSAIGLDVNTLLYRRIHLDLRRTASSACPLPR